MKKGLEDCKREKEGESDPMGGMFGKQAMEKLMKNPRIAGYFADPQFRNMFEMCKQNPQMLMQVMQMDPRFMDIFKELTGIDIMDMQQSHMKDKDKHEEIKKKHDEELAKKKEQDEINKKKEEEDKLPEEQKNKI